MDTALSASVQPLCLCPKRGGGWGLGTRGDLTSARMRSLRVRRPVPWVLREPPLARTLQPLVLAGAELLSFSPFQVASPLLAPLETFTHPQSCSAHQLTPLQDRPPRPLPPGFPVLATQPGSCHNHSGPGGGILWMALSPRQPQEALWTHPHSQHRESSPLDAKPCSWEVLPGPVHPT